MGSDNEIYVPVTANEATLTKELMLMLTPLVARLGSLGAFFCMLFSRVKTDRS
jgi:hypothetical protein